MCDVFFGTPKCGVATPDALVHVPPLKFVVIFFGK